MSSPITKGEKQAAVWFKVMERCAGRVELLRSQLEGDQSEESTAVLRGRIRELRGLMALDKDAPQERPEATRNLPP